MAKRKGRRVRRKGYNNLHGAYQLTSRRRQSLRKAQLVSARKRKGTGKNKGFSKKQKFAIGAGVTAGVVGAAIAGHKLSGSQLTIKRTKESIREGEPVFHTQYTPYTFDHGFRTGGGATTVMERHRSPAMMKVTTKGRGMEAVLKPLRGRRGIVFSYHFGKPAQAMSSTPKATPKRREPIDHDTIPLYNPHRLKSVNPDGTIKLTGGNSKNWPHVPSDTARKTNQRLRRLGMLR